MNKDKYAVIWDWDNTLVNTNPVARQALDDVCDKYGLCELDDHDFLVFMGQRWMKEFWDQFGAIEEQEKGFDYFIERTLVYSHDLAVMPEAEDVLSYFQERQIPQLLVSNKVHEIVNEEVVRLKLDKYFHVVDGSKGDGLYKPAAELAKKLLHGVSYEKILVIGDGASDMQFAKNLGGVGIFIRDTLPEKEKIVFDHHAKDMRQLKEILRTIVG
ncbi:MAG: HAD family hydrolase [Lactobacillales bacterium]|jgi:phosphoglycolate phosphatase|nr:HAD family hydrolase [Lactobacillales bacterium]